MLFRKTAEQWKSQAVRCCWFRRRYSIERQRPFWGQWKCRINVYKKYSLWVNCRDGWQIAFSTSIFFSYTFSIRFKTTVPGFDQRSCSRSVLISERLLFGLATRIPNLSLQKSILFSLALVITILSPSWNVFLPSLEMLEWVPFARFLVSAGVD